MLRDILAAKWNSAYHLPTSVLAEWSNIIYPTTNTHNELAATFQSLLSFKLH